MPTRPERRRPDIPIAGPDRGLYRQYACVGSTCVAVQQPPVGLVSPLKSMPGLTGRFFGGLMMTVPFVVGESIGPVMAPFTSYASPIVVLFSHVMRFVGSS